MAHKKGQGSSKNGRDSNPKRRGIKATDGQYVTAGSILVRQKGTQWHPLQNVKMGRDFTIFALVDGIVNYQKKNKTYVSVQPAALPGVSS